MKRVVTGTGRCGTGFVSRVLTEGGIECGHENVFDAPSVLRATPIDWGNYEADASWLAVPALPFLDDDVDVMVVLRRPLDVVQSLLDLGFFEEYNDYHAVIQIATPLTLAERTPQDRALAHWCHWNLAAMTYADSVIHIDSWGLGSTVARDYNTKTEAKRPVPQVDWGSFRPALALAARQLAEAWRCA